MVKEVSVGFTFHITLEDDAEGDYGEALTDSPVQNIGHRSQGAPRASSSQVLR